MLNLSRIQRCSWSDRFGIVLEIENVIDLVIREATPDELWYARLSGSIPTPAFTASAYAMFSVVKKSCKVCPGRREMASYRRFARSRLSRATFLYPFFQGTPGLACILQVLRGLACATLAWPVRQELHRADEPFVV